MTRGATQHGVLHDHAVGAHVHWAAVGGQHGSMEHAAASAHADLAAEYGGGGHVGVRVDGRRHVTVLDLHLPTMPGSAELARLPDFRAAAPPPAPRQFPGCPRPVLGACFVCRRGESGGYKAMSPALVGLKPQLPKYKR